MAVLRKAIVSLLLVGMCSSVNAQTLGSISGPAELPPENYTGNSFVDSKGCVFIRAGFSGADRWVPRILRSRKVVCGYQPTFSKSETRAVTAQSNASTDPVIITMDGRVSKSSIIPPAPTVVAAPKISTPIINPTVAPVAVISPTAVAPKAVVKPVVMAPKPSGPEIVRASIGRATIPAGYEPAWKDGRLNPNRGLQTVAGINASDKIWTRTTPQRSVLEKAKVDLSLNPSKLIYPFTNLEQQNRYLAAQDQYELSVQSDGSIIMQPKSQSKILVRTSSRNITPAAVAGSGHSFIQVGIFGDVSNADRSRAVLSQLGIPVVHKKMTRGGKSMTVVMAGPFGSNDQAKSALGRVKSAGYSDAYLR